MLCVLGNLLAKTKEDEWIECVSGSNCLHGVCSPHKEKCVDCGREEQQDPEDDVEYFVHYSLNS
jgi:hypothetical protein